MLILGLGCLICVLFVLGCCFWLRLLNCGWFGICLFVFCGCVGFVGLRVLLVDCLLIEVG